MKKAKVIIVGGGLAGLTAAIHLSIKGIKVILFEKEVYPHHKVCGEYLSAEVLPYLKSMGADLESLEAPVINKLAYSSNSGKITTSDLAMGGLGISRYNLDNYLYRKALKTGCEIIQESVEDINYNGKEFISTTIQGNEYRSEFVLGAYGKRSVLDKKLDRDFINKSSGWLGLKSHYKNSDYPDDLVSLHNFKGGYCGLSRTEMNTINVCYLATYKSFKKYKNTETYREQVLMQNPNLKHFFDRSENVFEKELSIAQVSFRKKSLIEDHIIMIGDSAGLIHPLCGNGMAMAIHSAKLASESIELFYSNHHVSITDMEEHYKSNWKLHFAKRIKAGRILQKILLNDTLSGLSQSLRSNHS